MNFSSFDCHINTFFLVVITLRGLSMLWNRTRSTSEKLFELSECWWPGGNITTFAQPQECFSSRLMHSTEQQDCKESLQFGDRKVFAVIPVVRSRFCSVAQSCSHKLYFLVLGVWVGESQTRQPFTQFFRRLLLNRVTTMSILVCEKCVRENASLVSTIRIAETVCLEWFP